MTADTNPGGGATVRDAPRATETPVPAPPTTLDQALELAKRIGQQLNTQDGRKNRELIEAVFLQKIAEE